MRAAIYARKSTQQTDVDERAKSVTRQVEGAQAFIAKQGWTLDDAHVYMDDGVSGAMFASRQQFQRMMRDAEAGAFDALVFFDLDRFGRDARKAMIELYKLADLGIDVYDYSTGVRVDLDSFEGEMMTFMKSRFAQQEREQARKRARDTSWSKAKAGLVTGGRTFGYDNVAITKGQKKLVPKEAEAEVVREIYRRFAAGEGLRSIAKALNIKGAISPRAQQGRPNGWSMSTVRAILERPIYRGTQRFGTSKKAYGRELGRGATSEKGQLARPAEEWLHVPVPDARIIDPDLEERVDYIRNDRLRRYKENSARGRAPEKAHGKYLLSGGLLVCPTCGGHFEARKYPWKGNPGDVYMCSTRRRKPGLCTNNLALPMARADAMLLAAIEGELLSTRTVDELLALVVNAPDETAHLQSEQGRVTTEIKRLVDSIAEGVPARSVAGLIRAKETELSRVEAKLRAPRQVTDRDRLRDALLQKVETWKADLRRDPKIARLVLRRLVGPFTLWTEVEEGQLQARPAWVVCEATGRPTTLLDDLQSNMVASPAGFEPAFWP